MNSLVQTAPGQNDQRFKDLCERTRDLARTHAAGEHSLGALAGYVVRAANEGVIDTTKNKHGDGKDDAAFIYEEYVSAFSKKAADAHSSAGKKANKSKLRQLISVGSMTTVDPVIEFDRWATVRKQMIDVDPKSVRPEYASYVEAARTQLACPDNALSDDQIKEAVGKPAREDKSVEDVLESVEKTLDKLISGESGPKDQHELTIKAFEAVRERLAALGLAHKQEAVRAAAIELGWVLNEQTGEMEKLAA